MGARPRHRESAPGDWYVDTDCIDCGASCNEAPGLIVPAADACVFARQPANAAEEEMAFRAMLVCPTASVRTTTRRAVPKLFPREWAPGVFQLGFNARSSFGANSWFIARADGNAMIDAPRWSGIVVEHIAAAGGLARILLTHRDDVADAASYARHFGARVSIHAADADAAPFARDRLEGEAPLAIADGVLAIPVPGHTRGSVVWLVDGTYLFTGDSLAWSHRDGDLQAFRDACWYSWQRQADSLERLVGYRFEWVLAGHGGSAHRPAAEMKRRLQALVARMRAR